MPNSLDERKREGTSLLQCGLYFKADFLTVWTKEKCVITQKCQGDIYNNCFLFAKALMLSSRHIISFSFKISSLITWSQCCLAKIMKRIKDEGEKKTQKTDVEGGNQIESQRAAGKAVF